MRKPSRTLVGALGLALLFGPWVGFAAGARSDPIATENRALAPRPKWRGFDTFKELTDYAADHFPLRDNAVRADNRLAKVAAAGSGNGGIGGPTNGTKAPTVPLAIEGRANWLFLGEDLVRACTPEASLKTRIAGLKRLASIINGSGRKLVFSIVPDKSTSEAAFLPSSYPLQDCATRVKADRRRALATLNLPGYVDAQRIIRDSEKLTHAPAYLPRDTHWTDRTGASVVKAIAERIDPTLADASRIYLAAPRAQENDLARMVNDTQTYPDPVYEIGREGVTANITVDRLAPGDNYAINALHATTAGPAKVFAPHTVWIGDSYSERAVHQIAQYFGDGIEMGDLMKAFDVGKTADGRDLYAIARPRLIDEIRRSKVVVMVSVERYFFGQRDGALVNSDFLDQLAAALR